jgi:uncharacterized protein YaaQ
MAKLLLVVLHQLDAQGVVDALADSGHRLTRIPSIGGLLGQDNTTLLMAVDDDRVAAVVDTITRMTSSREVELPLVLQGRLRDELPGLLRHSGATIMIAELVEVRQV